MRTPTIKLKGSAPNPTNFFVEVIADVTYAGLSVTDKFNALLNEASACATSTDATAHIQSSALIQYVHRIEVKPNTTRGLFVEC